jgi:hypothetical protein
MNDAVIQWLDSKQISNPHLVPDNLKEEFEDVLDGTTLLWPQPGGQVEFQYCPADICLYGGEAGSGKSFNLLLDHIKWVHLPNYVGTVVRKTYSQIFDAGGLWAEAKIVFGAVGGKPTRGEKPKFVFPSGAEVYFKHSQHAKDVDMYWQGLQSAQISIDELTHFERDEFTYIMSRNRSVCGVSSYMRMTCNPDPFSWVKKLIAWWLDEDGFVIPERSGVIRYMINVDDKFVFADTKEELLQQYGEDCGPKSFTFIRGYLDENQKLLEKDPEYKSSLNNLSRAQKSALRLGNWNEVDNPDALFQHKTIDAHRVERCDFNTMERIVIGIDPAGSTSKSSDETGIVVGGVDADGHCYIFYEAGGKYKPIKWAEVSCDLYDAYKADRIVAETNFGGDMVESTITSFRSDVIPKLLHASRGKYVRAEPVAMLYEKGMIHHVGHNLTKLEDEMCEFKKDQDKSPNAMDAMVWVITELVLTQPAEPSIRML